MQGNLFENNVEFTKYLNEYHICNKNKKRVHNIVPEFVKFYTIYQYNRDTYKNLMNEWLATPEGQSRTIFSLYRKHKEVLDKSCLRDENNHKLRDCDEKHIFRNSSLNYEPEYSAEDKKRTPGLHSLLYSELQSIGAIPILNIMDRIGHTIAPTNFEPKSYELDGLIVHPSDKQVEIKNTWSLPIKDRVIVHSKLLKMFRNRDKELYSSLTSIQKHTGFVMIMEGAKNPPNPSGRRNTMK